MERRVRSIVIRLERRVRSIVISPGVRRTYGKEAR